MLTYISVIGLLISFVGAILPLFVIMLPKIAPVGIFRNFLLKRFFFLATGMTLFLVDTVYSPNINMFGTNSIVFLLFWLVFFIICIVINPQLMFRAISKPKHFTLEESKTFSLKDDELVIGYISDTGKSLAWPLKVMLKPRHIINDDFEGKPILLTYCPLCRSGLVFDPIIDCKRFNFKVAGLYRRNLVMIDNETKTLWQQASGIAINGKLKDFELSLLPYEIMNWHGWKTNHSNTLLAWEPNKHFLIRFSHFVFQHMFEKPKMPIFPGLTKIGKEIDPREEVLGIKIDSFEKAYPLQMLKKNKTVKDILTGKAIEIEYNETFDSVTAWLKETNSKVPLILERHTWLAWKEFHPKTELYR